MTRFNHKFSNFFFSLQHNMSSGKTGTIEVQLNGTSQNPMISKGKSGNLLVVKYCLMTKFSYQNLYIIYNFHR